MRNGLPDSFILLTNSGAPGTGCPSCTSTPSMSVSQLSMTLRSFVRPSTRSAERRLAANLRSFMCRSTRSAARGGATVQRADVPVRQRTHGRTVSPGQSLLDERADHRDEARVGAGGAGAGKAESEVPRRRGGLVVEVPDHLEVIGDEADRADDDVGDALLGQHGEVVVDVGLQP